MQFLASFPPIFFTLAGQQIAWLPSEYFYHSDDYLCLGVHEGRGSLILGATFLRQKNLIIDLESNQLALTPARCS